MEIAGIGWSVAISAGNTVLLLGIIWKVAAWKTEVDVRIEACASQVAKITAMTIHPESAQRHAINENNHNHLGEDIQRFRDEMARRLERMEGKLDQVVT